MNKRLIAIVVLVVALGGILFFATKSPSDETTGETKTITLKAEKESNGYTATADITTVDGKITAIIFDDLKADGTSKRALVDAGEYVMTETGPTWNQQMDDVATYIIENQSTEGLTLNDEGKTDVVSSASVTISNHLDLVNQFLDNNTTTGETIVLTADAPAGDYTAQATVTTVDGKITAIVFDDLKADGTSKRALVDAGEYVMTETGPTWNQQMDDVATYIIENQSTEGLTLDDAGKTDVISSASVTISEHLNLINEFLAK